MNNTTFAAIVCVVMILTGMGAYIAINPSVLKTFNYETASPAEQQAYLDRKATELKDRFRPNIVAKNIFYGATPTMIELTYDVGRGDLHCGKEKDCKIRQCERYLRKSVSEKDIPIKVSYRKFGRAHGSQILKADSCKAIVARWDAGADQRKKEKQRKQQALCSDDYIGMKPLSCRGL